MPLYHSDVHLVDVSNSTDENERGVLVLNFNMTKTMLLNNLIKYERQRIAEKLCDLNQWDRKALSVHAIELGLRNRELAVVQNTLKALDPDQELNVCYIIAKFIQETKFSKDSEFKYQTITSALSYILELIEKRMNLLGMDPMYKLGEEEPRAFDSILIFKGKQVPITTEGADSVIKKLEIKNAKKVDKFIDINQTFSEIDEITCSSHDLGHATHNTISIIEDIMNSKQILSKPEEVLLLSNIIALLRSYLIHTDEKENEQVAPSDHMSVMSSFSTPFKKIDKKSVDNYQNVFDLVSKPQIFIDPSCYSPSLMWII